LAQKGKDLVIRVGGESGEGVISTGELITKAAAQASLHVSTFRTFPAEIKGGPAMFQVRVSDLPLLTHGDFLDVLMAFNQEAFDRHISELKKDGVLVYDSSAFTPPDGDGFVRYAVPLTDLAKKEVGRAQSKNMVALGVLGHLFELPYKALEEAIAKRFQAKGHKIVESNLNALKVGYDYVTREVQKRDPFKLPEAIQHQRMVIAEGELQAAAEYDYVVVNDDFVEAVAHVAAILDVEVHRVRRLTNLAQVIQNLRRDLAGLKDKKE